MRRALSISALALLTLGTLPLHVAAQSSAKPESARTDKASKKTVSISGTVGAEGKTLVSDRDNRVWKVVNPDLLSAIEGRRVTVRAHPDAELNELTVKVVTLKEERMTAKLDDVAFRR